MKRNAGLLFPISSLWGKYGIGTLGKAAYELVDFLKESEFSIWQILPLNVTSFGNSPYQSPSNYALNYYFIDFDKLIEKGLLKKEEVESEFWGENSSRVDYGAIFNNKLKVLRLAFSRFDLTDEAFKKFLEEGQNFNDFAIFMVLKDLHSLKPWYEWNDKWSKYSLSLEKEVKTTYKNDYLFYMWTQFEFLNEYNSLKEYANKNGIQIMGDLPIYVAYDSVEVWKYPYLFDLDENLVPKKVAGVPPDCFSEDGQLWGNPLYDWSYHKKSGYKWWNARIDNALKLYDLIRIDHFRGFSRYFSIPYGDKTARNGVWVDGPGFDLFKDKLEYPIVAEDLGMIDDKFLTLMKQTGYPGMKIVDQAFEDADPKNIWRPSNYTYNFFSYTGTHDSKTTRQFIDDLSEKEKKLMLDILEDECKKFGVPFARKLSNEKLAAIICELNFASKAKTAIIPIMDLFALGKEARINFPSTLSDDNWSWRMDENLFKEHAKEKSEVLVRWVDNYQRN